jgi:CheY-like chemotaxis protein
VHIARSGAEALARAAQVQPDVAILDIGMPGMTGYEVAEQFRREPWGRSITLIALTGWGQREDRRATRNAGFDFHMTKPTDIERLHTLLALAAERRKSAQVER